MLGPTPDQVAAQAASVLNKKPEARVIGIYTPGTWPGDADLQVGEARLPVAFCTSSLQIRDALVAHAEDHPPLVLVTNVPEDQLGWDVTARLAKRRLHHIDAWEIVRDRFRAHEIDTRLTRHPWMANTLLQLSDHQVTHVTSGFLDIDTAWQHLLRYTLGLDVRRPDAITLIQWSLEPANVQRFDTLSDDCREGLKQWVTQTGGAICAMMIDAIAVGYGESLLPIGLACDVLYAPDPPQDIELTQARTRLEPYLAGQTLPLVMARAWRDAAKHVLRTQADPEALAWLDRAHRLLDELKAGSLSHLSSLLIAGFNQRLAQFGHVLIEVINGRQDLTALENSLDMVRDHQQSVYQARRLERAHMAVRLARDLRDIPPRPLPASLDQGARDYVTHHAYVDWARSVLLENEEVAELAMAYEMLSARTRETRETLNQHFATLLARWHENPQPLDALIPIEQALPTIVAQAAHAAPILLVVIDGMSYAVFHEICADLKRRGWHALTNQPGASLPSLLSVIPSITRLSRTSFFAGALSNGRSDMEKQRFAAHDTLRGTKRGARPPVLFHKAELVEAGAIQLSETVRTAIGDPHQPVVGVVLNAVDDHLAKSDQLRLAWTVDQLQHLDALLNEAQLAGRWVVLTSDHGHVLDESTRLLPGGCGERWRDADSALAPEEISLRGTRIQQSTGQPSVVVPWSETVRYAGKKRGYHGGITPQEVLVPFGVLTRDHLAEGWEWQLPAQPAWWERHVPPSTPPPPPLAAPAKRPKSKTPRAKAPLQGHLFDTAPRLDVPVPQNAEMALSETDWIQSVLQSSVFAAQQRLAGRNVPGPPEIALFLQAFESHQYRLSRSRLSQLLQKPEPRLHGFLAKLKTVFNVEGYPILIEEEATGSITLNRQLLDKQFQIQIR